VSRFVFGLALGVTVGWVAAPGPATITEHVIVSKTETVLVEPEPVPTPFADSLVDWDRLEAETDCLWDFLQENGIPLTLSNVLTSGDWVDMHGGACAVMEGGGNVGVEISGGVQGTD